jgi:Putative Flp pilus-assembly TadE/G-like
MFQTPVLNKKKGERGSVAIMASLSMFALLGFTGLAVDVGYMQWMRARVQAAADAAVQAAIIEEKNNTGNQVTAAENDASLNGFANGVGGATVAVNKPPLNGALAGNGNAIEAVVSQSVNTFFMRIMGMNSIKISAYAGGTLPSSVSGCLYVLDQTDSQTFFVTGSKPTFNCGVVVESSSASAVVANGSSLITMGTNATVGVVGPSGCTASSPADSNCGISLSGQSFICTTPATDCSGSSVPTGNGISNPGDPLANQAVPSYSGLTKSASTNYNMNAQPPGNAIPAGVFCGGLTIGNTGGATYTLSGTYIIAGGQLNISQPGTVQSGSNGVTFYMTSEQDATANGIAGCGSSASVAQVEITGQANLILSAPTSGANAGILFFENRAATNTGPVIEGDSTTVLNGAMYFSKSNLTLTGLNASNTGYMMIVVNQIQINGSSPVVFYNVGNPLKSGSLSGTAGILAE